MTEFRCPFCRRTSPARDWIIEGSCSQIALVTDHELELRRDDQPTYWFHAATCPRCGEYGEFPDTVKLEWWEPIGKLYLRISEQLNWLQKR